MKHLHLTGSIWLVAIGTQYIAGLGKTCRQYHPNMMIPVTPGFVITPLKARALRFHSRREATALAKRIGGTVERL